MTSFHRWMIAFTVTLLAIIEVLDITIVSVALLNMKGALAATSTEITWTITVYVIASAIFMPLTGYLTAKFGRRKLLFASAIGFGLSSFLCGFSTTLIQIVFFRALQGAFGAILPSLAQATLLDTFSGKDANKAMAVFGMGIMLGPVIGPVLGGYITDHMGWQWIFFINVPVCIFAAMLTLKYIPITETHPVKNDWTGLALLAVGVGAMQYVLDKGNEVGWFDSHIIQLAALISIYVLIIFIVRGIGKKGHVIDFSVFKDKNYRRACLIMLLFCSVMMGTFSWLPLWMELFMNYPPETTGALMIPRGLCLLVVMGLSPLILKYIDARFMVVVACICYGCGSLWMAGFNLDQGPEAIFWPNILQGVGGGLFFVPLSALAYQTLPGRYVDTASGLFNFFRSMGTSVGVAIFSAVMSSQAQATWNHMSGYINSSNPNFTLWLHQAHMSAQNSATYEQLSQILLLQGNMIAFNDANYLFAFFSFAIIPFIFFIHGKKGVTDINLH